MKIIIFLINDNLDKQIISIISDLILKSITFQYIFFNKFIMNNINLEDYHLQLTGKLSDDINNRYHIIEKIYLITII